MSYFIFLNDMDNIEGSLYRIAENQSDLNNLNINKSIYKIIEESQSNFEDVKYGIKRPIKYNGQTITYSNEPVSCLTFFNKKEDLFYYIKSIKEAIQQFKNLNQNHPSFNLWNQYYNQLNSLNLNNITYPLNKTLEQYFKDLNQLSLSPLQLP
jgi:hypothetical protein